MPIQHRPFACHFHGFLSSVIRRSENCVDQLLKQFMDLLKDNVEEWVNTPPIRKVDQKYAFEVMSAILKVDITNTPYIIKRQIHWLRGVILSYGFLNKIPINTDYKRHFLASGRLSEAIKLLNVLQEKDGESREQVIKLLQKQIDICDDAVMIISHYENIQSKYQEIIQSADQKSAIDLFQHIAEQARVKKYYIDHNTGRPGVTVRNPLIVLFSIQLWLLNEDVCRFCISDNNIPKSILELKRLVQYRSDYNVVPELQQLLRQQYEWFITHSLYDEDMDSCILYAYGLAVSERIMQPDFDLISKIYFKTEKPLDPDQELTPEFYFKTAAQQGFYLAYDQLPDFTPNPAYVENHILQAEMQYFLRCCGVYDQMLNINDLVIDNGCYHYLLPDNDYLRSNPHKYFSDHVPIMVEVPVKHLSSATSVRLISWSMMSPLINGWNIVEDAAQINMRQQRVMQALLRMLDSLQPDVVCLQNAQWMSDAEVSDLFIAKNYTIIRNSLTEFVTLYNVNNIRFNCILEEDPYAVKISYSMVKTGEELIISNVHVKSHDVLDSSGYIQNLLNGDLDVQYIAIGNFNSGYVSLNVHNIENNIVSSVLAVEDGQSCHFTDGCFFSGLAGHCYQPRSMMVIDPETGSILPSFDVNLSNHERQLKEFRLQRPILSCSIEYKPGLLLDDEIVQWLDDNFLQQSFSSNSLRGVCLVWHCLSDLTKDLAIYLQDSLQLDYIKLDDGIVIYLPIVLLHYIEELVRQYAQQLTFTVVKIHQALSAPLQSSLWSVSPALSDFEKVTSMYSEFNNEKLAFACSLARLHFKTNLAENVVLHNAIKDYIETSPSLGQNILSFFATTFTNAQDRTIEIKRILSI